MSMRNTKSKERTVSYMADEKTYKVPCLYHILAKKSSPAPLSVQVPGSKSITNRALLLATLADGVSHLRGALFSDDSRHFLKCIQDLGFGADADEEARTVTVRGLGGAVPTAQASLYVGSAGTAARFLTAYLGLSHGVYHMDSSDQMRRRPMAPLLDSLQEMGCEIIYDLEVEKGYFSGNGAKSHFPGNGTKGHFPGNGTKGHFPFILHGHGFRKNSIRVNIDASSQFLSALLIVSCLCGEDFTTYVEGSHGMSYIEMTRKMMEQFGVQTQEAAKGGFLTPAGQHYRALDYQIEPDVSAACYFYAMSPLLGIPVTVEHVHFDSMQGDVAFVRILERMGCQAVDTAVGITVAPPSDGCIHGVNVDMSACSDQAITLAAIAPFADSPTTITGIGHIRHQESDRIAAIVTELSKMGITCEEGADSITIHPGHPNPSTVETYDDHRMAMGFSLIGLRSEGIVIANPDCCRKTFEDYFKVLDGIVSQYMVHTR